MGRDLIYTGEALNVLMLAVLWQAVMDAQHGEGVCQMDAKTWVETVGREWVETLGIRRSGVSGLGHKRRRERPGRGGDVRGMSGLDGVGNDESLFD